MLKEIYGFCTIFTGLIALKALTIGSDFNFYLWFKHGKKYTEWYFNRPGFSLEES